jgi:uncharacterized protein YdaU (DUF1376 family)
MHYYKFNIADWHLATSHLALEEEAVYFKLINFYYDTELPIPKETQSVIRRLRLVGNTAIVKQVLQEFFVLEDDGWHHKRCDDEILKYQSKAEINREVGKLGGRPKKINNSENPQITHMVSENNPQITLTTNHKPRTTNHITTPEGVSESLWIEFINYRKKLRAPVTETVLKRLTKEANLANMPMNTVIETIMFKGWRSFDATWIKEEKPTQKVNFL